MARILHPASAKSKKDQLNTIFTRPMPSFLEGYKTYIFLVLYALTEVGEKVGWLSPGTGDILKTAFLAAAGVSMRSAVKKLE